MNIWHDLGFSEEEAELLEEKSQLENKIHDIIAEKELSVEKFAKLSKIKLKIAKRIYGGKIGNLDKSTLEECLNHLLLKG
jgi:hypothetical protein